MFRHNHKPVCRSQTIKLSIQAVTVVTNHNQFNKGHAWMDTYQKVANHKPDKLSQNAPA